MDLGLYFQQVSANHLGYLGVAEEHPQQEDRTAVEDRDVGCAFEASRFFRLALEFPQLRATNHSVSGALSIDGEPWFVAKDVCDILSIQNVSQALADLDEDEKTMLNIGLPGRPPSFINESGLYSLILRSRKPEAKRLPVLFVDSEVPRAATRAGASARDPDAERDPVALE